MQYEHPDGKQLTKWGVTPPTSDIHGTEEDIQRHLQNSVKHEWRQEGSRLFCITCPLQHATEPRFTDYLLQGTDESGKPILKKIA